MDDIDFDFEEEIDAKDALRRASLRADGNVAATAATTRGRGALVCRHWLKNLCMKADKCEYLHQYDPNKMPECMHWQKFGKCNDPDCTLKHVEASERPECQRYRLGFCRYGPMCRSRHDRLPRESTPEILPDWFIDSLLLNAYVVPRCEDVGLAPTTVDTRRPSGGAVGQELALALGGTEQGTIPGLPPPIHGKCRYFLVRSMTQRNIQIGASKGIWATTSGNSQRLRQAFRDVDHVIIVFSATESRNFCGYGKMTSEPDDMLFPGVWGDISCRLGSNFRVQWVKQCAAGCHLADHIKNPQNDDLPVRRCRDGQELPSSVGERLCRFLWQQGDADLLAGSQFELEPRYEAPRLALQDSSGDAGRRQGNGAVAVTPPPLALEDARTKEDMDDSRSRPAPEKLGSHQAKPLRPAGGPGAVAVGKAWASGSSSLLADLAEEVHHRGPPPGHGGSWAPPPAWGPPLPVPGPPYLPPHHHRPPPHEWMPPPGHGGPPPMPGGLSHYPPLGPGYYGPPVGYPPPGGFRPPHCGSHFEARHPGVSPFEALPPAGGSPFEVRPPGFWGGGDGSGRAVAPPAGWEGASAAAPTGRNSDARSRSRGKKRHKEKRDKKERK